MHFLHTFLLLAPATIVTARPWPSVPSLQQPRAPLPQDEAAPPATTTGRVIPVMVGGAQDVFVPNVVTAAVGDVVQFQFSSGNHTATQSTADAACAPMAGGVHSGHIPFVDGQTTVGTFEMTVNSTDTMFMYCATGPHCQEGQVLVINPTDDKQVIDYADLSAATTESVDGTDVVGGTVGEIPLEEAIFDPPAAKEDAGGAAPPPAETAPPAESTAAPATGTAGNIIIIPIPNLGASVPVATVADGSAGSGTTTVVVTVPAAAATEAPAA
ncbi:hypothetical protein SLS62_000538 [Diatrype stigma]|uniref:Extracellular serine-rich protein n=1 Tax=Diatrype stigma TaxID=117547 RepID=A0AAN9VCC4_9PEZI